MPTDTETAPDSTPKPAPPSNQDPSTPKMTLSLNLALLWLGQFISILGDWCMWVAIPVTVYNRTGSMVDLAFTSFNEGLPYLIFSPIAGVIVDRLDRRKTMIAADIGRAVMIGILAVPFFKVIPLWEYYVVLFCASAFSAFFMPARVAVMTQVVPQRQLMRVNAILSTNLQIGEAIGPAIGGVILAAFLQKGAFLVDSFTFLASAACISGLSVSAIPQARKVKLTIQSTIDDLRVGANALFDTQIMRGLLVSWNVGYFAAAIFLALMYAYAKDLLHLGPKQYGFMMSSMGLGLLAGGLILGVFLHKQKATSLMIGGLVLSAVSAAGIAAAHSLPLACVSLFVFGFGALIVNVPAQTIVQTMVPRELLGRFSGAFSMVARIAQIAGTASAGYLGNAISLKSTYFSVAGFYVISTILAVWLLKETVSKVPSTPSLPPADE